MNERAGGRIVTDLCETNKQQIIIDQQISVVLNGNKYIVSN